MKRSKSMKRTVMKRGTATLQRTKFKRRKGRIGKMRTLGNAAARQHYFQNYSFPEAPGWAPCQACGRPMHHKDCAAHHKKQTGEDLTNKVAVHHSCHQGFIHDLTHPEHRKEAKHSPVDVTTGGTIQWPEELAQRLLAFKKGIGGYEDSKME